MSILVPRAWFKGKGIDSDKLLFYALVAAFFTMPLGTSPPTICGLLAVLIWIFSGRAIRLSHIYFENTWSWPVFLLIALPWIGLLYSPDPTGLGFKYAKKTHYWIYCLALASIVSGVFPPKRLIQAFLLGLAVNTIVAIFQVVGIVPLLKGEYRGVGPAYRTLSAYLVIGILMASYYFRKTEIRKTRFYLFLLMALYFFHLIVLKGRTGYFTFVVLSPLLVLNLLKRINLFRVSLICVLLFGSMLASPVVRDKISLTVNQLKYHLNVDANAAWGRAYTDQQDRFYMWYGAVHIFMEHPLIGVGTGGYQTYLKERGKPEDPLIAHPHNDFLYMAVSFGVVGIFAFLWLFREILKNAWEQRETTLGYFLFSTALVILVSGLFNAQTLDAGMAFLVAVTVGLQQGLPKFAKHHTNGAVEDVKQKRVKET
jgi:O-antigen ligase